MMYIRIRSWHIIRTWTRVPGRALTRCGKVATGEPSNDFGDEKTCESCLRLNAKDIANSAAPDLVRSLVGG